MTIDSTCHDGMRRLHEHSAYAPRPDYNPPIPAWKTFEVFRDALPSRDREEGTPS